MTLSSGSEILSKISTTALAAGYIHKQLQDHFKTGKFFGGRISNFNATYQIRLKSSINWTDNVDFIPVVQVPLCS